MAAPHIFIRRHLPLITPRIEFQPTPRAALPTLTTRIEFTDERLVVHPREPVQPPSAAERGPSVTTVSIEDESANPSGSHSAPESSSLSTGLSQVAGSSQSAERSADNTSTSNTKIPKPLGEPGRPGSGGYNLTKTLMDSYNWSKEDLDDLMNHVRNEATRRLNMNSSYRSQKKEVITKICERVMRIQRWAILADYDECWPVRSGLKLILKYSAEAARRQEDKKIVSGVKDMAAGVRRSESEQRDSESGERYESEEPL